MALGLSSSAFAQESIPVSGQRPNRPRRRLRCVQGGGQGVAPEPSDTQLVEQAQLGDPAAFAALVVRHERRAFSIAMGLLKDENDAREIVQEAFLRVHRGLGSFQGSSSFLTWLYRIVTNLSIDLLRRPQRRELDALEAPSWESLAELPGLAHLNTDPFDVLWQKELVRRISVCVAALPPYHRGVILMRELDGMSYEQMATAMGVSKGTIMSRLFHARQKLQRLLRTEHAEHVEPL